jgi:hypothetical protein
MQRPFEKRIVAGFFAAAVIFVVLVAVILWEVRRVEDGKQLAIIAIMGRLKICHGWKYGRGRLGHPVRMRSALLSADEWGVIRASIT